MSKKFKNFDDFINEDYTNIVEGNGDTYSYGCAMVYFDNPKLSEIHSKIDEDDIYTKEGDRTFGLETESHTTLLYGLHKEVDESKIFDAINKHKIPKEIKLENISLFKNEDYEVLKFDVNEKVLHSINEDLSKFPNTNDFPDYHPHSTIAYLKPGTGDKYVAEFTQEVVVGPQKIVYSRPDGTKKEKLINQDKI